MWIQRTVKQSLGPIKTGHDVFATMDSPKSSKIATSCYNEHALKTWDARTGELLSTVKPVDSARSLAWGSDQKVLVARCSNVG